jgi:hypothetical protein
MLIAVSIVGVVLFLTYSGGDKSSGGITYFNSDSDQLTQQLELFAVNEPEYNAILIKELVKLKAVELASLIEKAFAVRKVDIMIAGNLTDVQVSLRLEKWEVLTVLMKKSTQ